MNAEKPSHGRAREAAEDTATADEPAAAFEPGLAASEMEQDLTVERDAETAPGEQDLDHLLSELLEDRDRQQEADDFWDEAVTSELADSSTTRTFNLEEALRNGLVSPDMFGQEEEPSDDSSGENGLGKSRP